MSDRYLHQLAVMQRVHDHEAERSRAFAADLCLWAELHEAFGPDDSVLLELAGTAKVGQAKAAGMLLRGHRLVTLFPRALALLQAGELHVGTAELLLWTTSKCTDAVQAELGRRLTDTLVDLDAADARRLLLTTIPQVEAELEIEQAKRRHAQARANRGVWVKPVEDGMSVIGACVDALDAHRFQLDLAELVRAQGVRDARDGVERTKAQREADVLAELPSRHLALLLALRDGQADALLAQALAGAATDAEQDPAAPAPPLSTYELAVQLLRLPVHSPTTMYVHCAMSTLLDLDHRAGYLEGLGPIPAFRTRLLAPHATLQRLAVDPDTGLPLGIDPRRHPPVELDLTHRHRHGGDPGEDGPPDDPPGPTGSPILPTDAVLADDATFLPTPRPPGRRQQERVLTLATRTLKHTDKAEPRHDPSPALRRLVQIRDLTCTGPGCTRTATACELDHQTPYDLEQPGAGPTAIWNLGTKSPRCHHRKHHDWTVTHDPDTGISTWQSPAGNTYTRQPAWQPPTPLTDDLALPPARLEGLPQVQSTRDQWDAPAPQASAPTTPATAEDPAPRGPWPDGTPPF